MLEIVDRNVPSVIADAKFMFAPPLDLPPPSALRTLTHAQPKRRRHH